MDNNETIGRAAEAIYDTHMAWNAPDGHSKWPLWEDLADEDQLKWRQMATAAICANDE